MWHVESMGFQIADIFLRVGSKVHAFVMGDEHIMKLLAFRSYLIKNEEIAKQYAEIKRAGALASENDIRRYSAFKAGFIEHHLSLALITHKQNSRPEIATDLISSSASIEIALLY